jgi:hypothetical protein
MIPLRCIRSLAPLTLAAVLAPFAAPLLQDPKPAPAAQGEAKISDAEKEKKIRELLQVTNAASMGAEAMQQMSTAFQQMPGLPDGFLDKFQEMAKPAELVELIVPIYMKHIDAQDLDPVLAFFRTKSGERWIAAQKPIMTESMAAGQQWGRRLAQEVLKALDEDKAREKK